jgi:hypothetical protein
MYIEGIFQSLLNSESWLLNSLKRYEE